MHSNEYTSSFSWPAASHLAASPSPRHEGTVGQAPRIWPIWFVWLVSFNQTHERDRPDRPNRPNQQNSRTDFCNNVLMTGVGSSSSYRTTSPLFAQTLDSRCGSQMPVRH